MEEGVGIEETVDNEQSSPMSDFINGLFFNPVNLALLCVIVCLLYQLFSSRKEKAKPKSSVQPLAPMKKQDMTPQQLRNYDGRGEGGRVCIAVNGKIFDCTKGKRFYGPDGPYAAFAGRDASRGFATFSVDVSDKEYDDLSDLSTMEMDSVREWEMQFQERYDYVGRLLKPGEEPTDYSEEEDTNQEQSSQEAKGDKQEESIKTVEAESSGLSSDEKFCLSKEKDSVVFQKSAPVNRVGDPLDSIQEIASDKDEEPIFVTSPKDGGESEKLDKKED